MNIVNPAKYICLSPKAYENFKNRELAIMKDGTERIERQMKLEEVNRQAEDILLQE